MRKYLYSLKWHRYHPTAFTRFGKISSNESRSLDELLSQQEMARQKLVRSAMAQSAFYQEHYGLVGFEPGDMEHSGWFEKLPVVTKEHLRAHFDEFIDPSQRRFLKISTTGGSTGVPTKTGYDGRVPEEVYSWRLQSWFGVNPWDNHAYVWRDTRSSRIAKIKNATLWWPTRHLKMDATFITEEGMSQFIKNFNRLKPAMLQGYVGAITQLAQFVLDQGLVVHSPKFVWTTSAPLPELQRKMIAQAFRAPVCDQYGSCEIRWIAAQCQECGGLHVNTEHVHIEFVDDCNIPITKGQYGRTLLTNLEDTVFPLIRYENGDRGRWLTEECACGRTLPLIDSVKGRESESFVLPSGKTINGEFLTTIFDATPDLVKGFRVVQHKDLSITIEYISADGINNDDVVEQTAKGFARRIGGEVDVNIRKVNEIPHDGGKLRFVIKEH